MEKFSKKLDLTKEIPNTKYNMVEISLTHSHGGVNYFDNSLNLSEKSETNSTP